MSSVFSALNNNNQTPVNADEIKHNLRVTISKQFDSTAPNHSPTDTDPHSSPSNNNSTQPSKTSPLLSPLSAPINPASSPNQHLRDSYGFQVISDMMNSKLSASPPRSPNKHGRTLDNSLIIPASPHIGSRIGTPTQSPGNSGVNRIQSIKRFYYPNGIPFTPNTTQRVNDMVQNIFSTTLSKRLDIEQFMAVTTLICNLPSYINNTLFQRVLQYQQLNAATLNIDLITPTPAKQTVAQTALEKYMTQYLHTTDLAANLYTILNPTVVMKESVQQRHYLIRSDFDVYVNEIVKRHPGLEFLADTPDFQVKYSETVIARIFYQINVAGNERMTMREMKNSNFLDVMKQLDIEDDINKLNDYYSYEHFYVLYCKFWQLDSDHDGLIQLSDLLDYDDGCLTTIVCNRIIHGHGRPLLSAVPNSMNYFDFIIFFISEIDKSNEISITYWFNVLNIDNLDYLTTDVLYQFFQEQHARMSAISAEPIHWHDILCQLCDMVRKVPDSTQVTVFTRKDLIQCKMSSQFFNTLFNLNKFLHGESRDAHRIRHKHETPELNDWTRYACFMYFRLAESDVNDAADPNADNCMVEADTSTYGTTNNLFSDNSQYNKALNAMSALRETDNEQDTAM